MQSTAARSRLWTIVRIGAPLLLLMLAASGCMLPPDPATEAGEDVFNLYLLVLALAVLVFIGVEGFLIYAIFRYRRKPGDDVLPEQHHGNNTIEIVWTAIPTVIVLILFTFSIITLGEVQATSEDPGVTIEVDGFQWQWTFRYAEGASTTGTIGDPPTLYVPVGEPVRLVLNSLDVNHAFYVPKFLIKRDLIPVGEVGEPNELVFTVNEVGTYSGHCAEFCGTAHADMVFTVDALERADYDAAVAAIAEGEEPPVDTGDCFATVQLAAVESLRYDKNELEIPADESFCIEFTNNDVAPHDVAIVDTEFDGETIQPGESITYVVPALEVGTYTFYCTIHPDMVGDLIVTE